MTKAKAQSNNKVSPRKASKPTFKAHTNKSSARGGASTAPRISRLATAAGQSDNEIRLLINRKVILSDGYPRELSFDPRRGYFVARYAEGEFWLVDKQLAPTMRAPRHLVRRCGFSYPRPIKPVGHR